MSYDYATCRVCALETWYLQVLCRGGLRKYTPSLMHAVSLIVDGCLTILQRAIRICRFDVMMHAIGSVVQKVEKVHTVQGSLLILVVAFVFRWAWSMTHRRYTNPAGGRSRMDSRLFPHHRLAAMPCS
jgi:hypothetical protein